MNNDIVIPIEKNLGQAPLDLGKFISNIVGFVLIISAVAAFGYLLIGGINWLTAGGDKGKITEAKDRITNAIIGLAIVACSWGIFLLIDHFLGLNIANQTSSDSHPSYQQTQRYTATTTTTKNKPVTPIEYGNPNCHCFADKRCMKDGATWIVSDPGEESGRDPGDCVARKCNPGGADIFLTDAECKGGNCCNEPHACPAESLPCSEENEFYE